MTPRPTTIWIHSTTTAALEDEHDDEEAPNDNPVCPDCGSTRFRQYYWGSFSARRYVDHLPDGRIITDSDDPEIDEENGQEAWECDDCRGALAAPIEQAVQDLYERY